MTTIAPRSITPVGEAFRPPARRPRPSTWPTRKPNRLPLETYTEPGAYSLTLVTNGRIRAFAEDRVVQHCLEFLRSESVTHGFQVFAYCFMPDHLHLLVGSEDACDVLRFVKSYKQKTGYWYKNRRHAGGLKASPTVGLPLWQRSFHDHVVRSEETLQTLARYIFDNPVLAGLSAERGQYRWSGSFVWEDPF